METWLAQLPALITAVAVVTGLGVLLVAPLRFGRLATLALAPLASVAVLSVLAILLSWLGIPWTPLPILLGSAVFVALLWGVSFFLGRAPREASGPVLGNRVLIAGLVVGLVVGALRVGFYIGDALAISQTNDAVFHLNALRFALETGSVSSFDVSAVIGSTAFYPAAWHAVVLAVAQLSGATLPAAINVVSLVISTLIWAPGIAWLTRETVRRARPEWAAVAGGFAAALSPALLAFPLLMLQWGVLYPNALSVALVPAATALVLAGPRWATAVPERRIARIAVLVALIAAAAAAMGLAQPASLLAWLGLVASHLTMLVIARASRTGRGLVATGLQLVAVWGGALVAWFLVAGTSPGAHWATFQSEGRTLLDLATNSPVELPPQFGMSILMLIGLVVAVRVRALRWIALAWVGFAGLYLVSAAIDQETVRHYLVGPWYADPYRLAALLPLAVIPLAAIALTWLCALAVERMPRLGRGSTLPLAVVGIVALIQAVLLVVFPVTQLPLVTEHIADTQSRYAIDDETYLSVDERALLERLPEELPSDARIIGNPSTGMGFAFALSGVDAFPRTWSPPSGDEWELLAEHLRDAARKPSVCDALTTFGDPEYVIDFGPGETTAGRYLMPGFTDFDDQPGFTLVDREGDASIWRIDAC